MKDLAALVEGGRGLEDEHETHNDGGEYELVLHDDPFVGEWVYAGTDDCVYTIAMGPNMVLRYTDDLGEGRATAELRVRGSAATGDVFGEDGEARGFIALRAIGRDKLASKFRETLLADWGPDAISFRVGSTAAEESFAGRESEPPDGGAEEECEVDSEADSGGTYPHERCGGARRRGQGGLRGTGARQERHRAGDDASQASHGEGASQASDGADPRRARGERGPGAAGPPRDGGDGDAGPTPVARPACGGCGSTMEATEAMDCFDICEICGDEIEAGTLLLECEPCAIAVCCPCGMRLAMAQARHAGGGGEAFGDEDEEDEEEDSCSGSSTGS